MYLIGVAISVFCFWFFVTFLGGSWATFTDIPSLLPSVGLIVAVLAATNSFKVFYLGMRSIIFPKEELSEDMRGRAASLFRLLSKTAAIGSAIGVLISIVNMLCGLDFLNPEAIHIFGINVSAALISLLYGLFLIAVIFEPAVFILKKRSPGGRK